MANPQLTVEITAKIDGLKNEVSNGINVLKTFGSQANILSQNISNNIANVNKLSLSNFINQIKNGQANLVNFDGSLTKIQPKLSKLSIGSNQAAFALTNLGRVAQDAPFGFIGIQNNLNPLLESFQRLKAETGSASSAFKALASGLTGAGGIGLALSVVSSLYLVYTEYSRKASKADEEKAKNTKSAKEALDEYIKTLSASNQALVKGQQDAQKEIITLNQLYFASRNLQLPLSERIKAAKALQEQYPQTFKNFTAEEIALGKASGAYKQLAIDILAVAKASARTDILVSNEKEIIQLSLKKKLLEDNLKSQKEEDARQLKQAKSINIGGGSIIGTTNSTSDLERAANQLTKTKNLNQQIKDLGNQIVIKRRESLGIETEITKEQVKQQSVVSITGIDTTKLKEVKETIKQGYQLAKSFQGDIKLGNLGDPTAQIIQVKPIEQAVSALDRLRASFGYTDDELIDFVSSYGVSLSQLETMTIDFNDKLSGILNNGIISTFGNLGSAIGSALANGTSVAEAAGQSLLSSLGGILTQLGELAIATGVGIQAIKTALKSLNPVVAITAGVALVALGSLVKGKASKIGGGGGGSSATPNRRFGGTTASIQSPSTQYTGNSNGPTSLKSMVAGGGTQTIILDARLGNDAIYLAAKRGEKQQRKV